VDRLTGASERHATACIEFRPGCGLWTVVQFHDEAAHTQWREPVKAAFRLLADTGFGGERSRGWGRSGQPEFIEGRLPGMILPIAQDRGGRHEEGGGVPAGSAVRGREVSLSAEVSGSERSLPLVAKPTEPPELQTAPESPAPDTWPPVTEPPPAEPPLPDPEPELPVSFPEPEPMPTMAQPAESLDREPAALQPETPPDPAPGPRHPAPVQAPVHAHWLLSLFTPAPADSVDWARGNYAVQARGGRIDSPSGSGELKKQVQMVVEGSVLYADSAPHGAAADVAPDGFAHPVFRAGFALAIPLPGPEGAPS
jgi:hypothetical protein